MKRRPKTMEEEIKRNEDEDLRAGILNRNIGLNWKTVLPGLGMIGLVGAGAMLAKRRKRVAKLLAETGAGVGAAE